MDGAGARKHDGGAARAPHGTSGRGRHVGLCSWRRLRLLYGADERMQRQLQRSLERSLESAAAASGDMDVADSKSVTINPNAKELPCDWVADDILIVVQRRTQPPAVLTERLLGARGGAV